jgi:hypothetical protein
MLSRHVWCRLAQCSGIADPPWHVRRPPTPTPTHQAHTHSIEPRFPTRTPPPSPPLPKKEPPPTVGRPRVHVVHAHRLGHAVQRAANGALARKAGAAGAGVGRYAHGALVPLCRRAGKPGAVSS